MDLVTLVPILLPIFLFVVTLIIIFGLRATDKSKRGLKTISALLEKYKSNIEDSDNSFKRYAAEFEQTVARKTDEVHTLINTVDAQLAELKEYSEDLVKLKNAMDSYKTALEGLARLTEDADDKVNTVQSEADRLDNVRTVIDGFRQDMKDADEHLRKHEQRVIQLERESVTRMNSAVSETDTSMDEAMASLHKETQEVLTDFRDQTSRDTDQRLKKIDDAFQAVIHTVQQFFGELQHKLDTVRSEADRLNALIDKSIEIGPAPEIKEDKPAITRPIIIQKSQQPVQSQEPVLEQKPQTSQEPEVQVEITDIEYNLNSENTGNKYDDLDEELEKQWETYGEEEVVEFDDET